MLFGVHEGLEIRGVSVLLLLFVSLYFKCLLLIVKNSLLSHNQKVLLCNLFCAFVQDNMGQFTKKLSVQKGIKLTVNDNSFSIRICSNDFNSLRTEFHPDG